jgi:tRNA 2-thiouridine synthesizing protein A
MTDTAQAQQTLDCRGLLCPLPIIKLSKAIKTIQVGQVIEMLATDPGSVPDVKAFQAQTGHELLSSDQQGGVYRFLVRRSK